MKLEFLPLDTLSIAKANMRYAKKLPDVSDILPTVRARGILQSLVVRPNGSPGSYEILAGARRFHAASIVAKERQECGEGSDPYLIPCAILDETDDAAAIEASLIENHARLDPDEVTQWEGFVRLIRQGRSPADIAATFGLPDLMVKRILALGNLLPRIRTLYRRAQIDAATVRHLTLASKNQQKAWLALLDDPDAYAPSGHQLKSWLFGGQSIPVRHALFDLANYEGQIVADLFGEDRYFADSDAFWEAQNAALDARREAYLEEGWSGVIVLSAHDHFHGWEYAKAPKRKGGRVYIDVRSTGEVAFHEGYVTAKEAQRIAKGERIDSGDKPARPEISGPMHSYIDLHRHAAVRAALLGAPSLALRLMVAHAICGSHLWTVRPEPQTTRNEMTAESIETCRAETLFDERRRAVLDLLGFSPDEPTLAASAPEFAPLFARLVDLPDPIILEIIALIIGETLASGSVAVEAAGLHLGIDMADWWQADDAFFELLRDKEVLGKLLAEIAGEAIAKANEGEKTKIIKRIIRDHLEGSDGSAQVTGWVPRWMRFPPAAYTARGGIMSANIQERPVAPEPEQPESFEDPVPERMAA